MIVTGQTNECWRTRLIERMIGDNTEPLSRA
jgi:hypothetical protein